MKTKISFLILFLLPLAVLAQVSPENDTVWKKEIWPDYARSALFSKDDSKLYVNTDRAVLIYEPLSGSLIREVEGKGFFLFESPDGRFIFTDSLLKLDAQTYQIVGTLQPRGDNYILTDLSMSNDGSVIMASFFKYFGGDSTWKKQENNVIFYNPQNMLSIDEMTIKAEAWKCKISPDKNYFALFTYTPIGNNLKVVLFNYNTKQPIDTLQQHIKPDIDDIGWSPDSKYLAVLTVLSVNLYKFPEKEYYGSFKHAEGYNELSSFAFDKTSSYLATGGGFDDETNRLHIWDLATKQIKYKYLKYKFVVSKYSAFSNNNNLILTGASSDLMLVRTNPFITDVQEFEQHLSGTIYPNPVSNFALLTFQVQAPAEFDIELYNSTGIFVQQIFNGFLEAGENTINVNCTNLAAGVYYISINQNEFYKLIKEN